MIVFLIILTFLLFAAASLAVAWAIVERGGHRETKRVGKWYQTRVAELEQENAVLANQVLNAGALPIRNAMPLDLPEEGKLYAYDQTGLVREELDPRDIPSYG